MSEFTPKIDPANAVIQQKLNDAQSKTRDQSQLHKAAEDFEALFVYYMLRSMRKTISKSGLLGNGMGGDMWESMFDQQLAQVVAENTPLGIAELLTQQLSPQSQNQEKPLSPPTRRSTLVPYRVVRERLKATAPSQGISDLLPRLAPFESHIRAAAQQHQLDPNLIRAVILAESSGNPRAISSKGAKGLMQLMDSTAQSMGVQDPLDPQQNIHGGARYLAQLLHTFQGDLNLALAAYNAGPTAVRKYGGIPPFPETQQYVQKVSRYFQWLRTISLTASLK